MQPKAPERRSEQPPSPSDAAHTVTRADPGVDLFRSANAIFVAVDAGITELLGWRPEDLIGRPSTDLVHHEDQVSAVGMWFEMISNPGVERVWRGRYRALNGTWRWVETVNIYHPEAAPPVRTRMRGVEGGEINLEERLREREQVLSRLSDALPVGVFQFDTRRQVIFTNDRLATILGETGAAATTDALFASVEPADRASLEDAFAAVLADQPVPDFDIAMQRHGKAPAAMACSVALRTLTSRDGEVTGGLGCVSDVTEQAQLRRSLEYRASTDSLTGCLNRAASVDCLTRELAATTVGVAAIFLDLDHFKQVNDQYGHPAGDAVLQEVARRLVGAARAAEDWVCRLGGDEFLVVCRDVPDRERAEAIARRFADAVRGDLHLGGHRVPIRASAGGAWGASGTTADDLIADADREMYTAKTRRDGDDRVTAR